MQENKENTWITNRRRDIVDGVWAKCPECSELLYNGELDRNLRICRRCNYYFPMDPSSRISLIANDEGFSNYNDVASPDPENFNRTIMSGEAKISDHGIVIVAVNYNVLCNADSFLITEKMVSAINNAIKRKLPLLAIYTIGIEKYIIGSPMQLLNVVAGISKLNKEKLAYISLLSQTGSDNHFPAFAYSADIVVAESNLFGTSHTGSRIGRRDADRAVQTLFQSGIIDMIVPREDLKTKLTDIISFFR
jgi:acetyl-CoA carboxylase carboxyl transferase subunit beta